MPLRCLYPQPSRTLRPAGHLLAGPPSLLLGRHLCGSLLHLTLGLALGILPIGLRLRDFLLLQLPTGCRGKGCSWNQCRKARRLRLLNKGLFSFTHRSDEFMPAACSSLPGTGPSSSFGAKGYKYQSCRKHNFLERYL